MRILCLYYGEVIPRDTIAKLKQCGLRHVGTSMDKTLEERFLAEDNVVLDVWYYCCAHVAYVMLCACSVVRIFHKQC